MPHPVSVIVPHRRSRSAWFQQHGLPSIRRNDPAEVIVEDWEGGACEKRNAGASKATQPFLLFVDDDIVLYDHAIRTLLAVLRSAAFAYGDVRTVLYPGIPYPHPAGVRHGRSWNYEALRRGNYIETASLIRREVFPGFDPGLRRFQDWDLWLRLGGAGHRGAYVRRVLMELHHFDVGITAGIPLEEALAVIRRKHGLP